MLSDSMFFFLIFFVILLTIIVFLYFYYAAHKRIIIEFSCYLLLGVLLATLFLLLKEVYLKDIIMGQKLHIIHELEKDIKYHKILNDMMVFIACLLLVIYFFYIPYAPR